MGTNFASGLLAGVTSAVIWISICLLVGLDVAYVGLWALIFLVVGTVATTVIASAISRARSAPRG